MKVLYIVNTYPDANNPAAEPFVKAQIESIYRAGAEVEVLNIKGQYSKLNYLRSLTDFRRRLKKNSYDIVHGHYVYSGWIAVLQHKAPAVVSFMGSDLYGSPKANGTLQLRGYIDIWLSKLLQFFVRGIIVKSKEMQNILIRKEKSIVLPNGVDIDLFREIPRNEARKKLGLDLKKKYVLFIGNYEIPRKAFSIVHKAIDILKIEDDNIELLLACGLAQDTIPFYINAANVLAFPSLREGSPNVIKEALASNLPIITTDVGDVKELIEGVHGCEVVKRDPLEFAKAINTILATVDRTNGRKAIRHLTIDKVAQRLKSFYESLL